jgi:predicted metallo-beta-lactamase superfamily hydrolase
MSAIVEADDDTEIGTVKDIRTVKLISNDGEEFMVAAEIVKLSKMVATGIEGMKLPELI